MEAWRHNGVEGHGVMPSFTGMYEKSEPGGCIILGCSKAVWDDYDAARRYFEKERHYDIIAINDIGIQFKSERIQHICSLHEAMPGPIRDLRKIRIDGHCHTHSHKEHDGVDFVWNSLATNGGTSGIFAVKIAVAMGYHKIIVCGCGLDKTGHYYDPEKPEDNVNGWFDEPCRMPWKDLHKENEQVRNRVRVMSGELKELFGKPDHDWIYRG